MFDYDLIVLGAGPGGYVGAIRAARLGLKVAIVEKDKLGGVCLNVGCIPSKALIHSAVSFSSLQDWEKMGIKIDRQNFEYAKVFKKSRDAADRLSKGVKFLLEKNKIAIYTEAGKIADPNTIELASGKKITGKNLLIATGSHPRELPGFAFDEQTILSSTGALMLQTLPKSLLIIGAGAIGIEFAYIMNAFGVEVYMIELLDQILPLEDSEIAENLARLFKRRKIKITTSTKATSYTRREDGLLDVQLEKNDGTKSSIQVEKILVATGRAPNSQNIGLENVGITCERGYIPISDYYQTKVPGIFAIGDVIPFPQLAHVASKEAELAVEFMAGHPTSKQIDLTAIPSAVYCEPQVASFGYSEKKATEKNITFAKASFPYKGIGKAVATESSDGFVKVLYDPQTKKILGAHIIGSEATELIHQILLAKTAEILPTHVANMIHAHPTLSEGVMEAMRAIEGWAIHF